MTFVLCQSVQDHLIYVGTEGRNTADQSIQVREAMDPVFAAGAVDRMVFDCREMTGHALNGSVARAILVANNHALERAWAGTPLRLRLALMAEPGSPGRGVCRLLTGHAYDLDRLTMQMMSTEDEAAEFFGIDGGWPDRLVPLDPATLA